MILLALYLGGCIPMAVLSYQEFMEGVCTYGDMLFSTFGWPVWIIQELLEPRD